MRRLTIAMSEELYANIVEYAADESKRKIRRMSLGEAARSLITEQLKLSGYERAVRGPVPMDTTVQKIR